MEQQDYGDKLKKNLKIEEIECNECNNIAELRTMKIEDVHPEIVINTFECKKCHIKDVKIFDFNESDKSTIKISCNFNSSEDLRREVSLHKNATVRFLIDGFEYTYEGSTSTVLTVESILLVCIDDLQSQNIFGECIDKVKIYDAINFLEEVRKSGTFYMEITDPVGASRVAPRGKTLYEMQGADIERFNDEIVEHKYLEN